MPASLPSGGDPQFFNLGRFGVVGAALAGLRNHTQDNVSDIFRGDIQNSPGWGGASGFLFRGLDPSHGFVAGFLKAILERLLNAVIGGHPIEDLLDLLTGWVHNLPTIATINARLRSIFPGLFGSIHIGQLTNRAHQNFLVDGNFPNAASVGEDLAWTFDASVTLTADGSGSARTSADGSLIILSPWAPVAVADDQSFSLSAYVKCDNIAAVSGSLDSAFHLEMVRYSGDPLDESSLVVIGTDSIDSFNPGPGTRDWTRLFDNNVAVPDDGTTCVRVRLVVDPNVGSGTVWFDDASMRPAGFLHLDWTPEARDKFLNLHDWLAAIFGGLDLLDGTSGDGFHFFAAISNLIDNLLPHGRLAELFGGKLKSGQEPQTLLDTWKHLRDAVFGDSDAEGDEPGFGLAARLLQRLAVNANDTAQTGLHLLNFGANQPIWGHTNPTMQVPFGFLHLRKFATNGVTVTTHTDPESVTATPTQSLGVFNRWDKSRDVDLISWRGKGNSGITAMTVHVWRMDTATGNLTWLQSASVVPASLPTANFDMVYVPLAAPVHVDTGTVLAAEITTTGGNHSVAGADVPWLTDDLTARPKRQAFSRAVNAGASPPATIADASVTYSTRIPVISLGQTITALPAPKYVYTETFAGSTAAWKALAGSLLFSGSTFRTGATGHNFALFSYTPYGDDARVEFDLRATWNLLNQSFNNGDKIRLMMCCSASASQYVGLEIESNRNIFSAGANHALRIVTGTSPTGATTVRATALLDGDYTGLLGIEYDTATNTFRISLGGAPTTVTWTDSGHVIAHNADSRQAAIYANFNAANQVVCDNFSYRDI